MTPKEILIAARAKIADPKNWTQGAFQRNAEGDGMVSSIREGAVCWCAVGAVSSVVMTVPGCGTLPMMRDHQMALDTLNRVVGCSIVTFNDTHTHAEVLAKFDEAINAA